MTTLNSVEPIAELDTEHIVRITSAGKIKNYVDFSLNFLEEHPGRPLTFQTIPQNKNEPSKGGDEGGKKEAGKTGDARGSSVASIPRLISVVEIIKREYAKKREVSDGVLLYQYNQMSALEESKPASSDEESQDEKKGALNIVLGSSNLPRITAIPFVRVTLCTRELTMGGEATMQRLYSTKPKPTRTRKRRRTKQSK